MNAKMTSKEQRISDRRRRKRRSLGAYALHPMMGQLGLLSLFAGDAPWMERRAAERRQDYLNN